LLLRWTVVYCGSHHFSGPVALAIDAIVLSMPATVNLFWFQHSCNRRCDYGVGRLISLWLYLYYEVSLVLSACLVHLTVHLLRPIATALMPFAVVTFSPVLLPFLSSATVNLFWSATLQSLTCHTCGRYFDRASWESPFWSATPGICVFLWGSLSPIS
jgi:hypothetical protein